MGDKFRLYVDDVNQTIDCITDYARSHDLKIVSLNTLAPSLEDIFVSLTHKNKRFLAVLSGFGVRFNNIIS